MSYNGKNYVWANGKLSRIYCGNSAQAGTLYEDSSYTYNGFGQRIRKYYAYDPNPGSTSDYSYSYNTTYNYDHLGRLIREYCTERYIGGNVTTREFVFLYDESGMIGVAYSLNGATAQSYFFQRNLLGDVIGIYDTSGNQVAGYAYDAWGNCTIVNGAANDLAVSNPIRYRGYYYDRETGLYYCNARYYNSQWRRFISPDSTSYLDPETVNGLNLYCYCYNDPVNYADPSGHSALLVAAIIGFAVGAVLGGIYGGLTAVANDQNVIAGIFIGAFAGGIMGAGAGVASLYLAPALVGQAVVTVGGITYSAGTAVAVGSGIAFGSGVIGGIFADAAAQIVNDGGIHDLTSVMISGVQWGVINTAGAYLGSFMGPVSNLESGLLSAIFGSVTNAVGMTVDILRNRRSQKKKVGLYNRHYAYAF